MSLRCRRSWEAEAARDGRLTGEAHESFRAHCGTCATCAGRVHSMALLATRLREMAVVEPDELTMRRLRQDVLGAVDASRVDGGTAGRGRWALATLIAAALLGVAAFLLVERAPGLDSGGSAVRPIALVSGHPVADPGIVPRSTTTVEVVPTTGARFGRSSEQDLERVDLADGSLRLRIERPAGSTGRVVVRVPDGELEDVGTVFDVDVRSGRTERIAVEQGSVLVRLVGQPVFTVLAGSAWTRAPDAAPVAVPAPAASAVVLGPRRSPRPADVASADIADHAEDLAYLEVLRLVRDKRESEARAAAAAYLVDFPNGFRRAEMAKIARREPTAR